MKAKDARTLDLFAWEPPALEQRFTFDDVRAATLDAAIAKGISLVMAESEKSREEIADEMGRFLGQPISKNMLDAYASEARETHKINVPRYLALVHATGDRRLLSLLADQFGWAVVDRRYLKIVEATMAAERAEELADLSRRLRREAGR
ncbi:phage regulatory CII family protein [Oceanibaculum indicum]|uniref:Phage-related DNA transposition protein(B) n=1 Tax=Oceanibaculum indicum P24 TaxID=1207063 RepID=K2JSK5_9PROT|nr:phage regulatory CII family protein [Oceanibaculum indicum]EKE78468.1 phage-related DNA transposition protein(B) [Oceanibaculum indicum P24]